MNSQRPALGYALLFYTESRRLIASEIVGAEFDIANGLDSILARVTLAHPGAEIGRAELYPLDVPARTVAL